MANLGVLATKSSLTYKGYAAPLVNKTMGGVAFGPTICGVPTAAKVYGVGGKLAGTINLNGVPVANTLVRLYNRTTGLLVDAAVSGSDGKFAFLNVSASVKDIKNYTVVAFDTTDSSHDYNIVGFDFLTATPMTY